MKHSPVVLSCLRSLKRTLSGGTGGSGKNTILLRISHIENPDPYVMQTRYQADDGSEILWLINSHINNSHSSKITFPKEFIKNRQCWIWDPEDGKKYRVTLDNDYSLNLDMGPAESFLIVFDKQKKGTEWTPMPAGSSTATTLLNGWNLEFHHCRDGSVKTLETDTLRDIKDIPDFVHFAGTIIYRNYIVITIRKAFISESRKGVRHIRAESKWKRLRCKVVWPKNLQGYR